MKFLKKASLAAAIAAAPFAVNAEMVALDDATMSATTGQAGVTIEVGIGTDGISIDQIQYTDTKHNTGTVASPVYKDGGSVNINNLSISGVDAATKAAAQLNITQTIDVSENGDLVIGMQTNPNVNLLVTVGNVELQDAAGSNMFVGGVETNLSSNSELVTGVSLELAMGASSATTIHNVDVSSQTLGDFGVTGSYAANTAGLVIDSSMDVAIRDMNVGLFGYTADQSALFTQKAQTQLNTAATANGHTVTYNQDGTVATITDGGGADVSGTYAAGAAAVANAVGAKDRSAIGINNLTFDDGAGGLVNVNQKIWADGSGVYIQVGAINGTLAIGSIDIGGASIGSVAVSGIDLAGMTQKIYGH